MDINGKKHIQLAGAVKTSDMSGNSVLMTAKQDKMSDTLSDELKQQYKDTIRRLEDENARLWTILHSMLPATAASKTDPDPQSEPEQEPDPAVNRQTERNTKKQRVLDWIIVGLLAVGIIVLLYLLWIMQTLEPVPILQRTWYLPAIV